MHNRCLPALSSPASKASTWPATSSWTQSGPIDTGRSARCPPPLTDQAARQASAEKPPPRWLLHSSSPIALPAFSTHTPPAPAARHPPDQATCAGGWRPPSRRRASARALDQGAGCVQAFQGRQLQRAPANQPPPRWAAGSGPRPSCWSVAWRIPCSAAAVSDAGRCSTPHIVCTGS